MPSAVVSICVGMFHLQVLARLEVELGGAASLSDSRPGSHSLPRSPANGNWSGVERLPDPPWESLEGGESPGGAGFGAGDPRRAPSERLCRGPEASLRAPEECTSASCRPGCVPPPAPGFRSFPPHPRPTRLPPRLGLAAEARSRLRGLRRRRRVRGDRRRLSNPSGTVQPPAPWRALGRRASAAAGGLERSQHTRGGSGPGVVPPSSRSWRPGRLRRSARRGRPRPGRWRPAPALHEGRSLQRSFSATSRAPGSTGLWSPAR